MNKKEFEEELKYAKKIIKEWSKILKTITYENVNSLNNKELLDKVWDLSDECQGNMYDMLAKLDDYVFELKRFKVFHNSNELDILRQYLQSLFGAFNRYYDKLDFPDYLFTNWQDSAESLQYKSLKPLVESFIALFKELKELENRIEEDDSSEEKKKED